MALRTEQRESLLEAISRALLARTARLGESTVTTVPDVRSGRYMRALGALRAALENAPRTGGLHTERRNFLGLRAEMPAGHGGSKRLVRVYPTTEGYQGGRSQSIPVRAAVSRLHPRPRLEENVSRNWSRSGCRQGDE